MKKKPGRPPLPEGRRKILHSYKLSSESRQSIDWLTRVGGFASDTEAVEGAIQCWKTALLVASAEVEGIFCQEEWCFLADVNNAPWLGSMFGWTNPNIALMANASDGHALNGTGFCWFPEGEADARVATLCQKLQALTHTQSWAVLSALAWFWQHTEIDATSHRWWEMRFRANYAG